jgi:hypothetical protein
LVELKSSCTIGDSGHGPNSAFANKQKHQMTISSKYDFILGINYLFTRISVNLNQKHDFLSKKYQIKIGIKTIFELRIK